MASGFRSLGAFWVGGIGPGVLRPPGYRDQLAGWIGGATKPPALGVLAGPCCLLAFWMGGARLRPLFESIAAQVGPDGLPYHRAGRGGRRRPIILDDGEILDFLRLWVTWDNIEGP